MSFVHRFRLLKGKWRLAVFAMLASAALVQGSTLSASVFSDVPDTDPSADAIASLRNAAIITGNADGTFHPRDPIARGAFIAIIARAVRTPQEISSCMAIFASSPAHRLPFIDVSMDAWFAPFVCVGSVRDWVKGYSDGTFHPGEPVNLAAAAKILTKAFRLPEGTPADGEAWYVPYLRSLADRGALPQGLAGPNASLTREQMAEMVYRLQAKIIDRPHIDVDALLHSAALPGVDAQTQRMLDLTNKERSAKGLVTLRWNPLLEQVALAHAKDMDARQFYGHVNPDGKDATTRVRDSGYLTVDMHTCGCHSWSFEIGENLAKGTSPEEIVRTWMGSPVHRANILTAVFEETGIAQSGDNWVQEFGEIKVR